jgi:predicted ATPase/class 3 adenylate cyclase
MVVSYRSGRRADAPRTLERARVAVELEHQPGVEFISVERAMNRRDDSLIWSIEHAVLPTGTVTFLLTDVEGSTRAWDTAPERMGPAIERHYTLLEEAIAARGGRRPLEQGEGDSVVAVFTRASDAAAAALSAQAALLDELGDQFRVRMALHTGEAQLRDPANYMGESIIRAARLRACGHGGQILVSGTTADLLGGLLPVEVTLNRLGRCRLRDLSRAEEVWQLAGTGLPDKFPPLASLEAPRTNVPATRTPLIGRVDEVRAVKALFGDTGARVVTLTGPGGVGKTRLALKVASDYGDDFVDGVWWVELASLQQGQPVAEAISSALEITLTATPAPVDQVVGALRDRRALVVLDNCEHLLDDAAEVTDRLLQDCPGLDILATSREPLGIEGERVWRVPSLAVPMPGIPLAGVMETEAVQLFIVRARQRHPGFTVDESNAAAIAAVCRRLDGIPLALELAAARVSTMPVEAILGDLDERFRLLTGGSRTALPRHQTLAASVQWSHELLTDDERLLFRRLGVFVDGFTIDAAATIAELDHYDCLDVVGGLVDKSLVQFDAETGRYRLLETLRQYANDRAADAGELKTMRDRHVDWAETFLARLDMLTLELPAITAIDNEYPDLRAALEWAIATHNPIAISLVEGLGRYWVYGSVWRDAITLGDPVLAKLEGDDPARWAAIVAVLSMVRLPAGDRDFMSQTTRALEIASAAGADGAALDSRWSLGFMTTGDSAEFESIGQLATRAGHRVIARYAMSAAALPSLGTVRGLELLEQAKHLATGIDDPTFYRQLYGYRALDAALRGDQPEAHRLARLGLEYSARTSLTMIPSVASYVTVARQGDDADLLRHIGRRLPTDWRDLPGYRWWFAVLDAAFALDDPHREPFSMRVPNPRYGALIAGDLFARVLLTDNRDDDAIDWSNRVPESWPWAHTAGGLARSWVAIRRHEPNAGALLGDVIASATHLGLRPYASEGVEAAAVHLAHTIPEISTVLLTAADHARHTMGIRRRYPYHQQAVTAAIATCEASLGTPQINAARQTGATLILEDAVRLATTHLHDSKSP